MKLTYFGLRGRGEAIRYLFATAGVPFEDNRISKDDWENHLKDKSPWGFIPLLETDEGVTIAESVAINRYLARKFNLCGKSELDSAKCDEYVDAFLFIMKREWVGFVWEEQDPIKKKERKENFIKVIIPEYLEKLNEIIEGNGGTYLVGSGLTWADIFITQGFENIEAITENKQLVNPYPAVLKMKNTVLNNPGIKKWNENRPFEDFLAIVKTWEHKSK